MLSRLQYPSTERGGDGDAGGVGISLYSDYDGYFEKQYPFGMAGNVWHSHSGDIKISDMTEAHIRACMRIVGEDDVWYERFLKELKRREA